MKTELERRIARNLKRHRRRTGESQRTVGIKAGLAQRTVGNAENPEEPSTINLRTLAVLAQHYRVHPLTLFADPDLPMPGTELTRFMEAFEDLPPKKKHWIIEMVTDLASESDRQIP